MAKATDKDGQGETVEIEGVRVTHPDRVLFPGQGITKRALIDHVLAFADRMLPHVCGRLLSLVRCPEGPEGSCFFQRHASHGFPEAIRRKRIKEKSGSDEYLFVEDRAGLVAAVQMGAMELHIWGSHVKTLEKPDRLVFDLDPDAGLDFARVKDAAREMRDRLKEKGLETFLMATGGKGLHVIAPLEAKGDWDGPKRFAGEMARAMAEDSPDRYLAKASKAERTGRIFIDYLRNARSATAIAPFSTRTHEGAPVAWPLAWSDLAALKDARPAHVADAVALGEKRKDDPWDGYFDLRQTLPG
jgi:bifunctional non-homologous end joining protein LigD